MNMKVRIERNGSNARKARRLAKARRRAEQHAIERAKKNAKWRLCDRPILVAVTANSLFSLLILFGGYCKQAIEQVDPAVFAAAWDYGLQLVGA